MVVRSAKLASSVLAGLFVAAACGGSTGGDPGGTAGAGGSGSGVHCAACPAELIHANDPCSQEGDCCSYGGVCPLIYACVAGEWIQQASSNCGYAVPCGDKGLGCWPKQQCLAEPTPGGTSYSCVDAIDGGFPDAAVDATLPACGCSSAAPTIGEACECTGACGYLMCPAGEMDTIDCVDGKWTVISTAWDYYCGDGG